MRQTRQLVFVHNNLTMHVTSAPQNIYAQQAWRWGLDKEELLVAVTQDEFFKNFQRGDWRHSLITLPATSSERAHLLVCVIVYPPQPAGRLMQKKHCLRCTNWWLSKVLQNVSRAFKRDRLRSCHRSYGMAYFSLQYSFGT